MKMRRMFLAIVLTAFGVVPLSAHHSLTATYDTGTLVSLSGVITRIDVMNPHLRVELDAKEAGGRTAKWTIEMAPPNALLRRSVDVQSLKVGQQVTIESWLRKDGSKEATGRTLVTAEGKRVDVGDSLDWMSVSK